jgi:hypothetical protein
VFKNGVQFTTDEGSCKKHKSQSAIAKRKCSSCSVIKLFLNYAFCKTPHPTLSRKGRGKNDNDNNNNNNDNNNDNNNPVLQALSAGIRLIVKNHTIMI